MARRRELGADPTATLQPIPLPELTVKDSGSSRGKSPRPTFR